MNSQEKSHDLENMNSQEKSDNERCEVIDVKIFPYRFLKPNTTEKILNEVYNFEGCIRVLVHGPSLPKLVNYGPAKGIPVNHSNRKTINIQGKDVDLRLNVGEIIVTLDIDKLNDFMNYMEDYLNELLPFKYVLMIGIFTKTNATTSDYLKYGMGFENVLDERYIGMVDASAKSSDIVNI